MKNIILWLLAIVSILTAAWQRVDLPGASNLNNLLVQGDENDIVYMWDSIHHGIATLINTEDGWSVIGKVPEVKYLFSDNKNFGRFIGIDENGKAYRSNDNGTTWENVLDHEDGSAYFSKACQSQSGTIYIMSLLLIDDIDISMKVFTSNDFGVTWSSEFIIPDASGKWPEAITVGGDGTVYGLMRLFGKNEYELYKSNVEGKMYEKVNSAFISGLENIKEIAAFPSLGRTLMMRSNSELYRSVDGGVTWSSAANEYLVKSIEGFSHHDSGAVLILTKANGFERPKILMSTDNGESWKMLMEIWDEEVERARYSTSDSDRFYFLYKDGLAGGKISDGSWENLSEDLLFDTYFKADINNEKLIIQDCNYNFSMVDLNSKTVAELKTPFQKVDAELVDVIYHDKNSNLNFTVIESDGGG